MRRNPAKNLKLKAQSSGIITGMGKWRLSIVQFACRLRLASNEILSSGFHNAALHFFKIQKPVVGSGFHVSDRFPGGGKRGGNE
jgi:hypothetical protein